MRTSAVLENSSAARVIQKAGGHQAVAEWLGIHISRVYRFTYPKDRGGTGGVIPAEHQSTILQKAREAGRDLQPADFFEPGAVAAQPGAAA